jgi:hypothetical protein
MYVGVPSHRQGIVMRLLPVLCSVLLVRLAGAQTPGVPASVTGAVHDSIGGRPLSGAVVQLVAVDVATRAARSVLSDSLGRFRLDSVPAGSYMLGFFHPVLDSLGLEPLVQELTVAGGAPVRADLAIPSPARFRAIICGPQAAADSGAALFGVARDARTGSPLSGVSVTVTWAEISFGPRGLARQLPRRVITTASNGWFALCNIPGAGAIAIAATRGADSTDVVEIEVPTERLLRRDMYLGPVRLAQARRTDSLTPPNVRRVGDGQLTGVVVTASGNTPIEGAQVGVVDGPRVSTNVRGEWTLTGAPLGTRLLEVRAVGYYPERRAVDVIDNAPPVRTSLMTMKAVLDTVQVTASRLSENLRGFEDRRRAGPGRYLTPEDIARRNPVVTSDVFRMVPGMQVERSPLGATQLFMRGTFSEQCVPAIYLDGHFMRGFSADDVDDWVKPNRIAGIEVYVGAHMPAQFNPGMGAGGLDSEPCGSIVIWTKPLGVSSRMSWKGRVVRVVGIGVAALGVRALFQSGEPTGSALQRAR